MAPSSSSEGCVVKASRGGDVRRGWRGSPGQAEAASGSGPSPQPWSFTGTSCWRAVGAAEGKWEETGQPSVVGLGFDGTSFLVGRCCVPDPPERLQNWGAHGQG